MTRGSRDFDALEAYRRFVDEIVGRRNAGNGKRAGLDQLLKAVVPRKIDIVAAWSVDRLGRSLQDVVLFLAELRAAGVDLYLDRQAVDATTPAGKALFQMVGVFAEFERSIIQERINAGIAGHGLSARRAANQSAE